jgi:hypothetical protein
MDKEVEDRFDELEGQLLAQEHRFWAIVKNLLSLFTGDPKRTPKCKSGIWWSVISLIYGAIFPNSAAGTSALATVIAFSALYLQCNQIKIAEDQNRLIAEQNNIAEAAKLADQLHELQSKLLALPAGEKPPNSLHRESIIFSQSIVPLSRDPKSGRKLSSERGELLLALINSPADTSEIVAKGNFSYSDLKDARFDADQPKLVDCILRGARIDGANLSKADLREAYLVEATLVGTVLTAANLSDADATDADFSNSDLREADLRRTILDNADLTDSRLEGAIVDDDQWIQSQRKREKSPRGISWTSWKVERDADGLMRLKSKQ